MSSLHIFLLNSDSDFSLTQVVLVRTATSTSAPPARPPFPPTPATPTRKRLALSGPPRLPSFVHNTFTLVLQPDFDYSHHLSYILPVQLRLSHRLPRRHLPKHRWLDPSSHGLFSEHGSLLWRRHGSVRSALPFRDDPRQVHVRRAECDG